MLSHSLLDQRPSDRGTSPIKDRTLVGPLPTTVLWRQALYVLARPAGLEEGDYLPVHIGEPLDKDEVASVVEDAQPGTRDGRGQGRRVGDGHVAVLGAMDHERG